jgi:hypothetical protein
MPVLPPVKITSIACLVATASVVLAHGREEPTVCDASPGRVAASPVVRLLVVNQAGATHGSLAGAQDEARDIWAAGGLRLVWLERGGIVSPADGRTVSILVRDDLVRHSRPSAPPRSPAAQPLAWTLFAEGVPIDLIEVSLSAVTSLVMKSSYAGRRVVDLPSQLREHIVGRALGRVIAHEIGHWFGGPSHTSEGLMMPGVSGDALVDRHSPALSRGWIGAALSRRPAGSPGCQSDSNDGLQ